MHCSGLDCSAGICHLVNFEAGKEQLKAITGLDCDETEMHEFSLEKSFDIFSVRSLI